MQLGGRLTRREPWHLNHLGIVVPNVIWHENTSVPMVVPHVDEHDQPIVPFVTVLITFSIVPVTFQQDMT